MAPPASPTMAWKILKPRRRVTARLPRHTRLFNVGCRAILIAALVSWGTVSVSNFYQILYVHARYG